MSIIFKLLLIVFITWLVFFVLFKLVDIIKYIVNQKK